MTLDRLYGDCAFLAREIASGRISDPAAVLLLDNLELWARKIAPQQQQQPYVPYYADILDMLAAPARA